VDVASHDEDLSAVGPAVRAMDEQWATAEGQWRMGFKVFCILYEESRTAEIARRRASM